MLFARFTFAFTHASILLLAQMSAAAVEPSANPAVPPSALAPELEQAWQTAVTSARPQRLAADRKRLEAQLTALKEKHTLSAEAVKLLEQAIPAAAAEALPFWEQFINQIRQPYLRGPTETALKKFQSLQNGPNNYFAGYVVPYYHRPEVLPVWTQALQKALPPAAWQSLHEQRQREHEERHSKARELAAAGIKRLKPREVYADLFQPFWTQIEGSLPESAPEWKTLRQKVEHWAERYAERCEQESVLRLDSFTLSGPGWKDAVKHGYYLLWPPRTENLEAQQEQLLALLPAAVQEKRKALLASWTTLEKTSIIRTRVLMIELAVPLGPDQRSVIETLAATIPIPPPEKESRSRDFLAWKDWQGEPLKKLNEILDDRQERLWVQTVKNWESNDYTEPEPPVPAAPRHPGAGPGDPTAVEAAVSAYLAEGSRQDVAKAQPTVTRQIETAVRLLGLDETLRAELELAAKGSLQAKANDQRRNLASYVRSQMNGATAENVNQRLQGLGRISFSNRSDSPSLLEQALDKRLTTEQKQRLKQHSEQSRHAHEQVIIDLILAKLARSLSLQLDQHTALQKQLTSVMEKYGPDIAQTFIGWGDRAPWFLRSYSMMVPCFGLPEAELKKQLNKRQRNQWNELTQRSGTHYWEQVQRHHENRTKRQSKGEGEANIENFEP
jgi:hypothetical protein